jgi:hypothetical protein
LNYQSSINNIEQHISTIIPSVNGKSFRDSFSSLSAKFRFPVSNDPDPYAAPKYRKDAIKADQLLARSSFDNGYLPHRTLQPYCIKDCLYLSAVHSSESK